MKWKEFVIFHVATLHVCDSQVPMNCGGRNQTFQILFLQEGSKMLEKHRRKANRELYLRGTQRQSGDILRGPDVLKQRLCDHGDVFEWGFYPCLNLASLHATAWSCFTTMYSTRTKIENFSCRSVGIINSLRLPIINAQRSSLRSD